MIRQGIIDVTLLVDPVGLLAQSALECKCDQVCLNLCAEHETTDTVGEIGNLGQRRCPQLFVGGGVVDKIQELVRRLDHARHGTILK